MSDGMLITIALEEYHALLQAAQKLAALEAGGVDNWEWYDDAMEAYYAEADAEADAQAIMDTGTNVYGT